MRIGLTSLSFPGNIMPEGVDYVEDVPTKRTEGSSDMLGFLYGAKKTWPLGTPEFEATCRDMLNKWSQLGYNSFVYGAPMTRQTPIASTLRTISTVVNSLPRTESRKRFLIEVLDCSVMNSYTSARLVADAVSMTPNNWSAGIVLDLGEAVKMGLTATDVAKMPKIERFHVRGINPLEPFDSRRMSVQLSMLNRWICEHGSNVDISFESRADGSQYEKFIEFVNEWWRR